MLVKWDGISQATKISTRNLDREVQREEPAPAVVPARRGPGRGRGRGRGRRGRGRGRGRARRAQPAAEEVEYHEVEENFLPDAPAFDPVEAEEAAGAGDDLTALGGTSRQKE